MQDRFCTRMLWCRQAFSQRFVTWLAAMNHTRQGRWATTVMLSPATFSNMSISPNTPPLSKCSRMVGFSLPFSLSALADYISADRSAMMRELKKMREEHLLAVDGRAVTLYAGI